jgi:mono/diheme cytochrome c family protein
LSHSCHSSFFIVGFKVLRRREDKTLGRFWEGGKVKLSVYLQTYLFVFLKQCSRGLSIESKRKEWVMLRVSVLVFTSFVLGIALSQAVVATVPEGEVAANADLAERGLELYLANSCGVCHSFSKANTKGGFGPSHDGLGVIAPARIQDPNYKGDATTVEAYIRESLTQPARYFVPPYGSSRYKMPAYINLSEDDIEALTYFLLQP